jgi:hypothetical protein
MFCSVGGSAAAYLTNDETPKPLTDAVIVGIEGAGSVALEKMNSPPVSVVTRFAAYGGRRNPLVQLNYRALHGKLNFWV